jgi:hypothetical protein
MRIRAARWQSVIHAHSCCPLRTACIAALPAGMHPLLGKLDEVESPSELTINQTFCLYSADRQVKRVSRGRPLPVPMVDRCLFPW